MRHLTRKQKRRRKQMYRAAAALMATLLFLSMIVIGLAAIPYPASAAETPAPAPAAETTPTPAPTETENTKTETENTKTETENTKTETENTKTETENTKTKTENTKTKTENTKTETKQTALQLPAELEKVIDEAAAQYNLPADLVRAVIYTESRGKVDADNGLCYGLMQINRQYTQAFIDGAGVPNITEPANNICCGCWFLAELMQWADNDEALALMAYNLGQSKAKEYYSSGTITNYVEKVQAAKTLF